MRGQYLGSLMLKETLKVRVFGWTKIPMIGYVRPRVVRLDDEAVTIRLPLGRRTKNHWGTMYFGALAVGADLASGMQAMWATDAEKKATGRKVTLVFKDVQAEFLRRPDGDVDFTSDDGERVRQAVAEAAETGERVNIPVPVSCTVDEEEVARFTLTLSLKRK